MEYIKVILAIMLAYAVNFLAPITPFLVIVMILVAADLYTGIRAAKKLGEYEPSKASNGMRNTVNKISQYFIAVLLSQGMVVAFDIPTSYLPLTYIVAMYISLVELKSNFENIAKVTGVDLWEVVSAKLTALTTMSKGKLTPPEVVVPIKEEEPEEDEDS